MNINNINQLFNQKIQDINSRLPQETSVSNKFQTLLEQAQLNTSSTTLDSVKSSSTSTLSSNELDVNTLLKTMLSTSSLLNSTSFSSDSSSSLFPTSTFNTTINTLQQTQLLNALSKNINSDDKIQ